VARTLAQISAYADLIDQRLKTVEAESGELWAADGRFAEALRSALHDAVRRDEQLAHVRRELDAERELGRERDRAIAELRQENALLRQQLHDHLKRVEVWSGRLWTLVTVLVGAVLTLAAGLITTLAKK
jgi:chromosome segregation ATPase